ncbi:hypothetical protein CKO42_21990 [Lamprobacter modestohalophilus]|uniref:Uncharacterized protein n=1 Tax=Lamprobacter modestohalophilus TaxID=1064514 RepID=A0A9X1B623_9GAMM|nr:hypothetical protein [Lamprobacter modestohalophilus]
MLESLRSGWLGSAVLGVTSWRGAAAHGKLTSKDSCIGTTTSRLEAFGVRWLDIRIDVMNRP